MKNCEGWGKRKLYGLVSQRKLTKATYLDCHTSNKAVVKQDWGSLS